jgi:hypothetical protein
MAKLSLVIGSVLRDLAQSRVISDTFSRDVSVDYEEDPILRLFPVPRMEIKEISISIPITVKSVQPGAVRTEQIVKTLAKASAAKLGNTVIDALSAKSRNREALSKVFTEVQMGKRLEKTIEQKISQSASQIGRAVEGEKLDITSMLVELVQKELAADSKVAKELRLDVDDATLRAAILKTCESFVKTVLTKDTKEAVDAAQEKASVVDVGVTTEELAGIPEAAITRINLVTDVRNYQWTKIEEAGGKPVRQLIAQ